MSQQVLNDAFAEAAGKDPNILPKINMKKYFKKQFLTYMFKWQIGIIICAPLMYLFIDYLHFPYWLSMVCFNFVGAIVFYPIDTWIFKRRERQILLENKSNGSKE